MTSASLIPCKLSGFNLFLGTNCCLFETLNIGLCLRNTVEMKCFLTLMHCTTLKCTFDILFISCFPVIKENNITSDKTRTCQQNPCSKRQLTI